jgi:hypothetical protein
LCTTDKVVGKSSPLHNVINLIVLERHCQLDIALELTFGLAERALYSPVAMAGPTAEER